MRSVAKHQKVLLATEILLAYARVRWLMWRRDIRAVVGTVRVSSRRPTLGDAPELREDRVVALRLGGAVRQTLRILPTDSRCLAQALVLLRLLSARAIPSTVVIGSGSEPSFEAHAWIEHDGVPVLPPRGFEKLRLVEM